MQLLVGFLVVTVLVGGSRHGRVVRDHPLILMAFSTVVAGLYYSLTFIV